MKRANVVKNVVLYSVGFALLAYILWANWEPKGESPGLKGLLDRSPDWGALFATGVLLALTLLCQFSRWFLLVRAVGLPFTYHNAMRLGLVGYFFNMFLPGSIGGDLVKGYSIAKEQPTRRAVAVATVVIDRMFGLFGLLFLAAVVGGSYWIAGDGKIVGNELLQKAILFAAGAVGIAVCAWIGFGFLSEHAKNRAEARLHRVPKIGKGLAEIWFAVRTYRKQTRAVYLSVLLSAFAHVCMVLSFHEAVRVFISNEGAVGTLSEHFVVAPIGFIAQVVPLAPGGLGVAELIFGYFYSLIDLPKESGALGRLTLHMGEWLFGFLGYVVFLGMKKELPADTTAASVPPAE